VTDPTTSGAWEHEGPSWDEGWMWNPTGTPDPELVHLWGPDAIGDGRQNPIGEPNIGSGAWNGTMGQPHWVWEWGAPPNPDLVDKYGYEDATNPTKPPDSDEVLPPPNVIPPVLTDAWGGVVPDAGGLPHRALSGGTPVSEPPTVNGFAVSFAGLREAESGITSVVESNIERYNYLRGVVADSAGWDIFMENPDIALREDYGDYADNRDDLMSSQNNLLLQVADSITMAGDFRTMLNAAVQNYTRSDVDSFPPTE
jgi:hypothetical protein